MRISRPMAGMLAAITLATPAITLTAQTALADDATTTTTSTSTDAPTSTTDIPADVRDLLDASTLTINGQRTDLASMIHVDGSHRYDGRDWYGLSWTGPAIPDNARLETSGRLQYAQDDWTILTLEDDKTRIDLDLTCERDGNLNRSFSAKGLEISGNMLFKDATGRTLINGGTITKGDVYVMYGTFDGKATDKSSFVNVSRYDGLIVSYHHSDDGSVACYDVTDPHSGMRATVLFVASAKDEVTSGGKALIDDRVASHTRDFGGVDVHELTAPTDRPSIPSTPSDGADTPATPAAPSGATGTGQSTPSADTGTAASTATATTAPASASDGTGRSDTLATTGVDVESLIACMTAVGIAGLAMGLRRVRH